MATKCVGVQHQRRSTGDEFAGVEVEQRVPLVGDGVAGTVQPPLKPVEAWPQLPGHQVRPVLGDQGHGVDGEQAVGGLVGVEAEVGPAGRR
ncbi:MAG: hypothetical protein M3524_10155 [Actinomycetota bacterium]|nr:hypothetical protein [Actinomycetota bacterium]